MRAGRRIGVVIPALNEELAIAKVIAGLPSWVDRIVVVDNGSTDRTSILACAAGATVVSEPEKGYVAACLRGVSCLDAVSVIAFLDGDYSDYPEEIGRLVDPILSGANDLVVGSRTMRALPGSLTVQQRFGNWLACGLIHLRWGVRYSDLGPFRAIDADALRRLGMQDRNYGWTVEMQIRAAIFGLRVQEVAVGYRPRLGASKVSGTVRGTIRAGTVILRTIGRLAWRGPRFP